MFLSDYLWNTLLTALAAITLWWVKSTKTDIDTLRTLIHKTREDSSRDFVTKEMLRDHNTEITKRLDRLESKIDTLVLKLTNK